MIRWAWGVFVEGKRRATRDATAAEVTVPTWNLTSLTPEFLESEHAQYVATITEHLTNNDVLNIALSGNYGVGKSSILRRVADDHDGRVVELSLSTLTPIDISKVDDSSRAQAWTLTNQIQQEIVKQLLYREEPKAARASRFRRIERFSWSSEILFALLGGIIASLAFMILGWAETIEHTLRPLLVLGLGVYPLLTVAAILMILGTRSLLHGRIHIRQLSAGPAAVTLDENSVSYFDQYLDEIVYFFETSKRDIVIFEDIDRFNNSHIFETLRSLNVLLNASPQIKNPIRFIYAIKDSIFDRANLEREARKTDASLVDVSDPAEAEIMRANRTKFFDLVIPVVPFITHQSARNLTAQTLRGIEHEVSPDLIDLSGRFVPDMRLLKNVRNEFVVFRDRIFAGDGNELELSQTQLFAMMLYKSTHLSDFEIIRLGKSNLDKLYDISRALVSENIRRVEGELRGVRIGISRRDKAQQRASRLGKLLVARIDLIVRAGQHQRSNGNYLIQGKSVEPDEFESVEFWRNLASIEGNPTAGWRSPFYGNSHIELRRDDISALVGDSLDVDEWREADLDADYKQEHELEEQLAFLRTADMGELMRRPDYEIEYNGLSQSLGSVAENLLSKGLAYNLLLAGYIDRNFTLYTSTFHGDRVSPAATNFIIHHVERGLMDEHFVLAAEDAEAVIRERGARSLSDPAMFNIAILDYLLATNSPDAEIMITAISRLDSDGTRFLQSYLSSGASSGDVVRNLAKRTPRILNHLISVADLDDRIRRDLVSICLQSLPENPKQLMTEEVNEYLNSNYSQLPAIADVALSAMQAERIALLFKDARLELPDLSRVSDSVRQAFVEYGLYEMTLSNLKTAVGSEPGLALDDLRAASRNEVYLKALAELSSYLDAIEGYTFTNRTAEKFDVVAGDVHKFDPDNFERFVSGVSDDSSIESIDDVPTETWPVLAKYNKFPATFSNVKKYIDQIGSVDESLAVVLTAAEGITGHEDVDEDTKRNVAITLISNASTIGAVLRAKLAESLLLENYIEVNELSAESGDLYAELIARQVILGDAMTYKHLAREDWTTRERVIAVSPNFLEWVTPELVGGDLANLLSSNSVPDNAKRVIIENADDYVPAGGQTGLLQVEKIARKLQVPVTFSFVEQLASHQADTDAVLNLLMPHLDTVSDEKLFGVLSSLGGDYAQLTRLGRDKPKIPNTADNRRLLESLKQRGIVTKSEVERSLLKVHKRYGS